MSDDKSLTDWAIHVVEMAHQSSAGGLGTDDLDQSDLIEREAAKVAHETDYRQSRIEERATKIAEKGSGL